MNEIENIKKLREQQLEEYLDRAKLQFNSAYRHSVHEYERRSRRYNYAMAYKQFYKLSCKNAFELVSDVVEDEIINNGISSPAVGYFSPHIISWPDSKIRRNAPRFDFTWNKRFANKNSTLYTSIETCASITTNVYSPVGKGEMPRAELTFVCWTLYTFNVPADTTAVLQNGNFVAEIEKKKSFENPEDIKNWKINCGNKQYSMRDVVASYTKHFSPQNILYKKMLNCYI